MRVSEYQRAWFNRRAKMIEKALCSLHLPARVQGGQISASGIRYHLTPLTGFQAQQVYDIADKLAQAVGAYYVRVAEEGRGLMLDLPLNDEQDLLLLQVLKDHGNLLPLTAIVGLSTKGDPFCLNFCQENSWHLFAHGSSGTGKSELLRTVIVSTALNSRLSLVQFLGIDLSGRELTLIEGLPHGLADVACDPIYAQEMLQWLLELIERRNVNRIRSPHIILAIDGVDLLGKSNERTHDLLKKIAHLGLKTGVHLFLTSREARIRDVLGLGRNTGFVIAKGNREEDKKGEGKRKPGDFSFLRGLQRVRVQVAWMPVFDLQEAMKLFRSRQREQGIGRGSDIFHPWEIINSLHTDASG